MNKHFITTLATAAILLACIQPSRADDWPQWRGINRDGKSGEKGLLKQWTGNGPARVWSISDLGEGYGTGAVVGDRIYIQGTKGEESVVFCLNKADGKQVWMVSLGPRLIQDKGNGPRGTPTVENGLLYVENDMGEVACMQAADGKFVWRLNMLKEFGGTNTHWGISESPLVDGDHLIVTPGGKGASVVALNKKDGKTVWKSEDLSDGAGYSSCVAQNIGNIRVYATFTSAAGVGVRASDGKLMWRYTQPANGTANIATPIFSGDKVFYSSAYGTGGGLLSLAVAGDSVKETEVYFNKNIQNHHGGVVLLDGYLYGFSDAILTCMKLDTGEVAWKERSVGKGSLVYADGNFYVLGEKYVMGLVEATPAGYHEKGRFKIEDRGQPSWAHPVVSGGKLYIRNQDMLTCYDVKAQGGPK